MRLLSGAPCALQAAALLLLLFVPGSLEEQIEGIVINMHSNKMRNTKVSDARVAFSEERTDPYNIPQFSKIKKPKDRESFLLVEAAKTSCAVGEGGNEETNNSSNPAPFTMTPGLKQAVSTSTTHLTSPNQPTNTTTRVTTQPTKTSQTTRSTTASSVTSSQRNITVVTTSKTSFTSVTATSKSEAIITKTSRFDLGSFVGGIVLTLGLLVILYFGCKTYHSRRGIQYRTM
ncbi:hypothetical protein Q9233_013209 [Columba guinea]|nr:hypothetical protein Q9233_013209 [Columba guinea]